MWKAHYVSLKALVDTKPSLGKDLLPGAKTLWRLCPLKSVNSAARIVIRDTLVTVLQKRPKNPILAEAGSGTFKRFGEISVALDTWWRFVSGLLKIILWNVTFVCSKAADREPTTICRSHSKFPAVRIYTIVAPKVKHHLIGNVVSSGAADYSLVLN